MPYPQAPEPKKVPEAPKKAEEREREEEAREEGAPEVPPSIELELESTPVHREPVKPFQFKHT